MKPSIVVQDSEPVWDTYGTPPPVVQPSKSAELAAHVAIFLIFVPPAVALLIGWIR